MPPLFILERVERGGDFSSTALKEFVFGQRRFRTELLREWKYNANRYCTGVSYAVPPVWST